MSRTTIPAGIDWESSGVVEVLNPLLWDAIIMKSVVLPDVGRLFEMARGVLRCIACGEPTYNQERCRDCDIEHLLDRSSCRWCGVWIVREDIAGPARSQHQPDCPLKNDQNPFRGSSDA